MYANLYFCDIVAQKYIFSKTNVSFSLPRSTYTTISTRTVSASLAERRQTFCSQFKLRHVGILRKSPELSEMAPDSKKNRIQKKIVRCLKTSDQRRKIEGGGVSREEEDEPLVGKPNLQGVENTGAIPRTYHRSRLQPGSILFNSCSPPRPFSPPFPKRKEAEKRAVRPFPPPDLGIFSSFFALFLSLSSHPLPRYRVPDKKMAGRLESSFLKNARTCLRAHRTYTIDDHTPTRAQFPLLVGESISEDLENA